MKNFAFTYRVTKNRKDMLRAVFFFSKPSINPMELLVAIDQFYQDNPLPDEYWFLGTSYNNDSIISAVRENEVKERIRIFGKTSSDLKVISFEKDGKLSEVFPATKEVSENERSKLLREGSYSIFQKRNGLMPKSDYHHYVKPSTRRVDKFIRTGNTLVDGSEVDFLAMKILPYFDSFTNTIYTDSHTIVSLLQAAFMLWNEYGGSKKISPKIYSFDSYLGLDEESFSDIERGFVVISASTEGRMVNDLVTSGRVPVDKILTIFYLGRKQSKGDVLCDLTKRRNQDGIEPVEISEPGDSSFFKGKSLPIYIEPQGFFPNSSISEAVMLKRSDLPNFHVRFASTFFGNHAISCNGIDEKEKQKGGAPVRVPVQIDFTELLKDEENSFTQQLSNFTKRALPITTRRIIFLDDCYSEVLAKYVADSASFFTSTPIKLISSTKLLQSEIEDVKVGKLSTDFSLVVAACVSSGDALVELSQHLRDVQLNHGIGYLVGLSISESCDELTQIRTNLDFSESGRKYHFETLIDIFLPDHSHRSGETPWELEDLWYSQNFSKSGLSKDECDAVESRLKDLNGSDSLIGNLFLSTFSEPPLALRRNSVLTNGIDSSIVPSQADVFVSIYCWFHCLRKRKILDQNPLRRRLLDPANFFRYNDGVIQSAILRAADYGELSYSLDPKLSSRMTTVLDRIFDGDLGSPRCEAFPEFLLSMALDRLTLCKPDRMYLIQKWKTKIDKLQFAPFEKVFLTYLSSNS